MEKICLLALLLGMVLIALLAVTVKGGAIAGLGLVSGSLSAAWLGSHREPQLGRNR